MASPNKENSYLKDEREKETRETNECERKLLSNECREGKMSRKNATIKKNENYEKKNELNVSAASVFLSFSIVPERRPTKVHLFFLFVSDERKRREFICKRKIDL